MKNIDLDYELEEEYDFSDAEQGKFYNPDAIFISPIYLEPDVNEHMSRLAAEKNMDIQAFLNDFWRNNMQLIESVQ
ncbi:MAG: hypothetical protein AAF639_43115 [Chloroflexota bacterium]